MPRKQTPIQLIVQLDNQYQQAAFGAPALLQVVNVAVNERGEVLTQPSVSQMPVVAEDIDDELLAALDAKFAILGLELRRRA